MKRRRLLIASGSAVLGSSLITATQRSAVGVSFTLSQIEQLDPTKVDSVVVQFENATLTPTYLDSSKPLDIEVQLQIDEDSVTRRASVSFQNSKVINLKNIDGLLKSDTMQIDGVDTTEQLLSGEIAISVEHTDIGNKEYVRNFNIGSGIIDNFESSSLSPYTTNGTSSDWTFSTNSKQGTYSLKSPQNLSDYTISLESFSGLDSYPSAGDTFELYVKADGAGNSRPGFSFGHQENYGGYHISNHQNNNYLRLSGQDSDGNGFILEKVDYDMPYNEWTRWLVDWGLDGTIIVKMYDSSGNKFVELSGQDEKWKTGGIRFAASKNDNEWYDNARILGQSD